MVLCFVTLVAKECNANGGDPGRRCLHKVSDCDGRRCLQKMKDCFPNELKRTW